MKRVFATSFLVFLLRVCLPVWAQIERLDDSSSPRSQVRASLDGGGTITSPNAPVSPIVRVSFGTIQYRLNTSRYVGRRARIFYVLPAGVPGLRSPGALQVTWRTDGLFTSGTGHPGDRVQVWNGVVRDAWINESLDLGWQVDMRQLRLTRGAPLGFEAYFEIEILP